VQAENLSNLARSRLQESRRGTTRHTCFPAWVSGFRGIAGQVAFGSSLRWQKEIQHVLTKYAAY
jgi:hypothetical protein